jgi:hypothetical protein
MDTEPAERETRGIFDSVFVCHGKRTAGHNLDFHDSDLTSRHHVRPGQRWLILFSLSSR